MANYELTYHEQILEDFREFVGSRIPNIETDGSYTGGAQVYSVEDTNALLPVKTVRFEYLNDAAGYEDASLKVFLDLNSEDVSGEVEFHELPSLTWSVGDGQSYFRPGFSGYEEGWSNSNLSNLSRVMSRMLILEAAGKVHPLEQK
jgi:hypothetical protein